MIPILWNSVYQLLSSGNSAATAGVTGGITTAVIFISVYAIGQRKSKPLKDLKKAGFQVHYTCRKLKYTFLGNQCGQWTILQPDGMPTRILERNQLLGCRITATGPGISSIDIDVADPHNPRMRFLLPFNPARLDYNQQIIEEANQLIHVLNTFIGRYPPAPQKAPST